MATTSTPSTTTTTTTTLPSPAPSPNHKPDPTTATAARAAKPMRALRILCFGDSLTSGYTHHGAHTHPYSHVLSAVLARAFPSLAIEAHVDGLPGDAVVAARFLRRIEPKFLTKGGGTPYDWTVVLGGTNDLFAGPSAQSIYEGLRRVWAVPLSKGGRVLACTVPEVGLDGDVSKRVLRRRDELNRLIKGHKQANFYVFDLHAAIPYWSMREEERKRYWDDDVHFTPDGYDLMGEKIAAALVNIIMPPGRLQASSSERAPKRRRIFKDDDKKFEEESGDDSLLDQGYYVVRRQDLE